MTNWVEDFFEKLLLEIEPNHMLVSKIKRGVFRKKI